MMMAATSAVVSRMSCSGNAFDFSNSSRIWNPVSRNSRPSTRKMMRSQKKMPCSRVADEIKSGPFQLM